MVVLVLATNTFAQQKEPSLEATNADLQILVESQAALTAALNGILQTNDEGLPPVAVVPLGGVGTSFPPTSPCTSAYLSWDSSDIYQESEWSTTSLFANGGYFQDVNGDGLTDHIYIANSGIQKNNCVNLNNGAGWDLVYKCFALTANPNLPWTFYGDCAQQ